MSEFTESNNNDNNNSNDNNKVTKTTGSKSNITASSGGNTVTTKNIDTIASQIIKTLANTDIHSLTNDELKRKVEMMHADKQRAVWERREAKRNEKKDHTFWNTQPMPGNEMAISADPIPDHGPIDPNIDVSKVRQDPLNMPNGFEWCSIDIMDPVQAQEVYTLLTENYVEDDECMFRFDYSVPFLQWALTPPHYNKDWHVGVRSTSSGKLMGCITGIPASVRVHERVKDMVEINYLCVHKKLRTKRLAPVLIKEITRRVNVTGRWQACYTAGVLLPKPIALSRYYHRSLQPKKLIEVRFSSLPKNQTLAHVLKNLKLPNHPTFPLRPMTEKDVPRVHELIQENFRSKKLVQEFTIEEIHHILLPRDEVVECYVLETRGVITDVCSFYHLPSTIIGHPKHKKLNAVYSYYNVATSMPLVSLMQDALIIARNGGADVFNALDVQGNSPIFEPLKFGQGDGNLQYYVYNWKAPVINSDDIGLVLL